MIERPLRPALRAIRLPRGAVEARASRGSPARRGRCRRSGLKGRLATASLFLLAFAAPALAQTPPAPVGPKVDAPGKLPGPPPSVPDLAYDARLLSSAASAESFQGPLDGSWTLAAEGQGDLFGLQFTDKREGLEGAWRDLRRPGDPKASGFVDQVSRSPAGLSFRLSPEGQPPVTVALGPNLRGRAEQAGQSFAVALRRKAP